MTMIRKQFFIDRDTSRRLQRVAAAKGVSEAELIRAGIDLVLAGEEASDSDWRSRFRACAARVGDLSEVADRVEANKVVQAERWRARVGRSAKGTAGR